MTQKEKDMTKTPTPGRKKPTQVVSTDKDGLLKG